MKILAVLVLFLSTAGLSLAGVTPPNWSGRYASCDNHSDLLNSQHVDLGVRISTSNAELAQEFERAMDFWSGVLDIDWHEVDSQECAIQLVDGTPSLFNFCVCLSARSQFPDRDEFQGWIAFNPRMTLTRHEMFLDAVHEIGHLLGLPHNPSESSVMYYFGLNKTVKLDATDLGTLAARHQLRAPVRMVRVVPRQTSGRQSHAAGE